MKNIRLFKPSVGEEELNAVKEVFDRNWLGLGPKVGEFEDAFTDYLGRGGASVAVNSATAALHLALDVYKFEEKKEEFTWLQMIWENPSVKKDDNLIGEGLEGIEEDLRQLNEEGSDYTLKIENKKNRFRVTLNYRSDLLMLKGSDTPELEKNYFS